MGKNKIIIFLLLCFLGLVGNFLFAGLTKKAQAANDINFVPQVTVGDFTAKVPHKINPNSIGEYIVSIYKYAIGIVGILAAVVMMFGGVRWIMAGGNASAIGEAKAWIGAALTGLLLALGSWMILNTINPSLVTLQPINITKTGKLGNCCSEKKGSFSGFPSINPKTNQQQYSCQPRTEKEKKEYGTVEYYSPREGEICTLIEGKYKKITPNELVYCAYQEDTSDIGDNPTGSSYIAHHCEQITLMECQNNEGEICQNGCSRNECRK